jgi:hypothetical protein
MNKPGAGTARSIGLTGLLRFLVAAAATVAIGAAIASGSLALAAVGAVAVALTVFLSVRGARARHGRSS